MFFENPTNPDFEQPKYAKHTQTQDEYSEWPKTIQNICVLFPGMEPKNQREADPHRKALKY